MKERRLAVSPKRTEHLLECAKRSPERDWSSTAAILLAGDADQHVQQLPGCPIVCTLQQLEAQNSGISTPASPWRSLSRSRSGQFDMACLSGISASENGNGDGVRGAKRSPLHLLR